MREGVEEEFSKLLIGIGSELIDGHAIVVPRISVVGLNDLDILHEDSSPVLIL